MESRVRVRHYRWQARRHLPATRSPSRSRVRQRGHLGKNLRSDAPELVLFHLLGRAAWGHRRGGAGCPAPGCAAPGPAVGGGGAADADPAGATHVLQCSFYLALTRRVTKYTFLHLRHRLSPSDAPEPTSLASSSSSDESRHDGRGGSQKQLGCTARTSGKLCARGDAAREDRERRVSVASRAATGANVAHAHSARRGDATGGAPSQACRRPCDISKARRQDAVRDATCSRVWRRRRVRMMVRYYSETP